MSDLDPSAHITPNGLVVTICITLDEGEKIITLQQKEFKFIHAFIRTKDLIFSAQVAGIDIATAKKYLRTPKLNQYKHHIEQREIRKKKVCPEWIKDELVKVWEGEKKNKSQMEAIKMIGNMYGLFDKERRGEDEHYRFIEGQGDTLKLDASRCPSESGGQPGQVCLPNGGQEVRQDKADDVSGTEGMRETKLDSLVCGAIQDSGEGHSVEGPAEHGPETDNNESK